MYFFQVKGKMVNNTIVHIPSIAQEQPSMCIKASINLLYLFKCSSVWNFLRGLLQGFSNILSLCFLEFTIKKITGKMCFSSTSAPLPGKATVKHITLTQQRTTIPKQRINQPFLKSCLSLTFPRAKQLVCINDATPEPQMSSFSSSTWFLIWHPGEDSCRNKLPLKNKCQQGGDKTFFLHISTYENM